MIYPSTGTIDGTEGTHLLLAPPYIIENRHIDEILDKFPAAVDAGLSRAGAV